MRELFVLDKKNYNPNGSVGKRPSVRGIILRDGMIAMMHSQKYNYYFICEAEEVVVEQELDAYEAEERFILEFVPVQHAITVNNTADHLEKNDIITFRGMLDRENRVLELLQEKFSAFGATAEKIVLARAEPYEELKA